VKIDCPTRRRFGVSLACLAAGAVAALAPVHVAAQATGTAGGRPRDAAATPSTADSGLRLATVYEIAARRSPRVRAAAAAARAAEARVPGTRRPPDPELQLGFMNRELPSLEPMDPLGMTQIQLMQMVPTPGKLGLAGRVADAQATAARDRAADTRWDVRARVAMAFYDLYQADRTIAIEEATRRLVQDVARTAQAMYAVGEGRQADVLRAQLEVARMSEELLRMRAMRAAMSLRLAGLLDLASDTSLAPPVLPALPSDLPPIDSLQRLAGRERPMIRAGLAELRAAEASSRLARRESWPDLEVGVQYGQRAGEMGTERMGSLMIGTTIPIFARSRQLRMREEAEAMRAMAGADVDAMRAETRARLAEVYADITRARNLGALYRTTILPQASATVASSLAAYRVGEVPLMQLLESQMDVNRYQRESIALDAETGKAIAELEMLLGRALFDPNQTGDAPAGSAP